MYLKSTITIYVECSILISPPKYLEVGVSDANFVSDSKADSRWSKNVHTSQEERGNRINFEIFNCNHHFLL